MKLFCAYSHRNKFNAKYVEQKFTTLKTSRFFITQTHRQDGRLFLASLTFAVEPYQKFYKTKDFLVSIDGYVFNPDYIDVKTGISTAIKLNPFMTPESLLRGYLENGVKFIKNLNGSFAVIIFNFKKNCIDVITDRHGSKPIFYYSDNNQIIFASELKAFPKQLFTLTNIDWASVSSILTYQQIFGNATLLKNVKLIPPGSLLRYNAGQIILKQYLLPKNTPSYNHLPKRDILRISEILYKNAILKTAHAAYSLNNKLTIPLSGGYDTRLIASILKKGRLHFTTISTDKDVSNPLDSIIAKKISSKLGVSNRTVALPSNLYKRFLTEKIKLLDGMITEEHLWLMPLINKIEKPIVILDGFRGDVLARLSERQVLKYPTKQDNFSGVIDTLFPTKTPTKMPKGKFLSRTTFGIGYTSQFLQKKYFKQVKRSYKRQLIDLLKTLNPKSSTLYTDFLIEWTRRNVLHLTNNIAGSKMLVFYPYLENQLFEFLANISNTKKIGMNFTKSILEKMMPDVMKIESTNDLDIKEKYRTKLRKETFFNQQTTKFLKSLTKSVSIPPFIKLRRFEFIKKIYKLIDNRKSHQDIALLEFIVWYNLFFDKRH